MDDLPFSLLEASCGVCGDTLGDHLTVTAQRLRGSRAKGLNWEGYRVCPSSFKAMNVWQVTHYRTPEEMLESNR